MKKMSMCIIALSLTASGSLALTELFPIGSPLPGYDRPFYENWPEEKIAQLREDVKDAKKLQERLKEILHRMKGVRIGWTVADFMREFDVKEDVLETALIGIYHTPPSTAGWHYDWGDGITRHVKDDDKAHFYYVTEWLSFCANTAGKKLLMDFVADKEKQNGLRSGAACSYLRRADIQEVQTAIPRFLAVMKDPFETMYRSILSLHDEMWRDEYTQKREAIATAVAAVLVKEEDKKTFTEVDGWLAERSKPRPDPYRPMAYRGILRTYEVMGYPIAEHLGRFYPHGGYEGGQCCPCPPHKPHHSTPAKLTHLSQRYSWTTDIYFTRADGTPITVGSTVNVGEPVLVAGMSGSYLPWDAQAVFEWTENGKTTVQTNAFTVMSAHIVANICGGIYSASNNVVRSLFPQPWDWLIPVTPQSGLVYGYAMLSNHISLPGYHTLSLDGTTNAVQIWLDYYDVGDPVLYSGHAMTNPPLWSYLWVESLTNGTATFTLTFTGTGIATNFNYKHSIPINVVDLSLRLLTDTDNNGTIDEAEGGECEFAQYAPGRLILMKGEEDGTMTPGPRAETRFKLTPSALAQSGTVTLSAVEGGNRVELWDAEQGGAKITLPATFPAAAAPQTLWVSGVSTGTAVLAASYAPSAYSSVSNLTAYTVLPPLSVAPAVSNAYIWCSLPNLGDGDGVAFSNQLHSQGFNVRWFRNDNAVATTNFGTCTLANYKEMANAGAFTVISHGGAGEHLAVYAPYTPASALACTNWCEGYLGNGMTVKSGRDGINGNFYCVSVDTSWLETNWQPSLSNNNAIAMWSICYSADTSTGTSVKEAAGGRWRSGYELVTAEDEASDVNNALLGRMNGTISNGVLRTAGSAYNDLGVDGYRQTLLHHPYGYEDWNGTTWVTRNDGSVRMDGNWWTTLCPAPLASDPVHPASYVMDKRKGWGCILLDTTLDNKLPATDAIVKDSGGAVITDTRWLKDIEGNFYGVGFLFDKMSGNSPTTIKAVSEKIRNKGSAGRAMDGNRVQPNTDDKQWSF